MKNQKCLGFILSVIIILLITGNVYADERPVTTVNNDTSILVIAPKPYEIILKEDSFTITLNENPTTGYRWEYTILYDNEVGNVVEVFSDEYINPETNLIGSGGKRTLVFKAISDGKCTIRFDYKRNWEEEVENSFQFIVKVDEGRLAIESDPQAQNLDEGIDITMEPLWIMPDNTLISEDDPVYVDTDLIAEETDQASAKKGLWSSIIRFFENLFNSIFGIK